MTIDLFELADVIQYESHTWDEPFTDDEALLLATAVRRYLTKTHKGEA